MGRFLPFLICLLPFALQGLGACLLARAVGRGDRARGWLAMASAAFLIAAGLYRARAGLAAPAASFEAAFLALLAAGWGSLAASIGAGRIWRAGALLGAFLLLVSGAVNRDAGLPMLAGLAAVAVAFRLARCARREDLPLATVLFTLHLLVTLSALRLESILDRTALLAGITMFSNGIAQGGFVFASRQLAARMRQRQA